MEEKQINLHWDVMSAKSFVGEGEKLHWATVISVKHVSSEEEAIKKAKKILPGRRLYHVKAVMECNCGEDNFFKNALLNKQQHHHGDEQI